ncbi:Palmitoyl-protein thioesterase [Spironucleus salmonicida]|uniref:Palmitoyl-protein thioesterase n=1 Tax=Spironucleus salmonicida TaxID=348837 RepID=V6LFS5_9EUKA|nr:Palmitoyl-protein thioesterase [Spironucleus salmonicida]|eukprot:EST43352.1 Palmitoyl-protein thioesterase [Spironucleus salmonicida]
MLTTTNSIVTRIIHGCISIRQYEKMARRIEPNFFNCEIGNGVQNSLNLPIQQQADQLAQCIESHNETKDGFIGLGHQQGGFIMRYYLQMRSHINVKMIRFVTLGSPLAGNYCNTEIDCKLGFAGIQADIIYQSPVQSSIATSNYWRDPTAYDKYVKGALALPVINNEREFSQQVKTNFMSIDKLVMFASPKDEIIRPWQSSFLGFFKNGSSTEIVDMEHTDVYLQDLYGLKTMNEQGRIVKIETLLKNSDYITNQAFIQEQLAQQLIVEPPQSPQLISTGAIIGITLGVIAGISISIFVIFIIIKLIKKSSKGALINGSGSTQYAI